MSGRDWMTAAITTATTTALTSLPIMVFSSASRCGMCVSAVGPQRLDLVRGEEQVLGIRPAGARPHPDPAAPGHADPGDHDMIRFRRHRAVRARIPPGRL